MLPQTSDIPPSLPQGSNFQSQRLDHTLLSNRHDWILAPERGMSLRNTVEQADEPRTNLACFKLIAAVNRDTAKNLFSTANLAGIPTLFRIPETLHCDRTSTRDNEEAYYLDAMDDYLSQPTGDLDVKNLPILRRRPHSRLFCAFSRKPGYRSELFERRRLNVWTCHDARENEHYHERHGDTEVSALHAKNEDRYEEAYLPPALAIPTPFVYFYYHREMRVAQLDPDVEDSEPNPRMKYCGRKEFYILAIAMWWNEVFYGGRHFVLDKKTIDVLGRECGTILNIAGKPTQAILEHMRLAAQVPERYHNWMCFNDGSMESSTFVFCHHGEARTDHNQPTGTRFFCDRLERKITGRRYEGSIFKRVTTIQRRLTAPELDEVQGLLGLVDSQGWRAHGSLRVGDLLYHLLTLNRQTESRLGDAERALDATRRKLEYTRRTLDDRNWRISDMERRLHDMNRRSEDNGRVVETRPHVKILEQEVPARGRRPHSVLPLQMTQRVPYEDPYGPNEIIRPGARRVQTPNLPAGTDVILAAAVSRAATPRTPSRAVPSTSTVEVTALKTQQTPSGISRNRAGYPLYRSLPSGNLPWTANHCPNKRSRQDMEAGTPATEVDTASGTGPSSALTQHTDKRARTTPGPSARPSTDADGGLPPRVRDLKERDPALKKLASRHPVNKALTLRAESLRREQQNDNREDLDK